MELYQEAAFCASRSGFGIFDDVAGFPHHGGGGQGRGRAIGPGVRLLHGKEYDIMINAEQGHTNSWPWLASPL